MLSTVVVGVLLNAINIILYRVTPVKWWNQCSCHKILRQRLKLIIKLLRQHLRNIYQLFSIKSKFVLFIAVITYSVVSLCFVAACQYFIHNLAICNSVNIHVCSLVQKTDSVCQMSASHRNDSAIREPIINLPFAIPNRIQSALKIVRDNPRGLNEIRDISRITYPSLTVTAWHNVLSKQHGIKYCHNYMV